MKKLLGILVAVAMISALTITASAGIANGNGSDYDEGDSKYVFEGSGVISGFTITFDIDDPDSFGGGIIWYGDMFEEGWWDEAGGWIEFGDDGADKPIVSDGATIQVTLDAPVVADGAVIMMEQWWGSDMTITGIDFTYATPTVRPVEVEGTDPGIVAISGDLDKDKQPDSGVGDVAVASAIALVAAGAVMFSRKKK
jgi:hypothetical protein